MLFSAPEPTHLDLRERLVEIGNDVLDVFNPDRQPHQPLCDPNLHLNFRRYRGVRHQRGQGNQRLDAAEAFRQRAQPHVIQKLLGGFSGPRSNEIMAPKPRCCFLAISCWGWEARPGKMTCFTLG